MGWEVGRQERFPPQLTDAGSLGRPLEHECEDLASEGRKLIGHKSGVID